MSHSMKDAPAIRALFVWPRLVLAPLYVDDELLSQLVLREKAKQWPAIRGMLEREGLPPARRAMGGLRYLPATLKFFDFREGIANTEATDFVEDRPPRFDR